LDKILLEWLKSNRSVSLESPRRTILHTKTQRFRIIRVHETKRFIEIEFSKQFTVLRLEFWRFDTALEALRRNRGKWTRLGTRFDSEDPDTIEWQIQNIASQSMSFSAIHFLNKYAKNEVSVKPFNNIAHSCSPG